MYTVSFLKLNFTQDFYESSFTRLLLAIIGILCVSGRGDQITLWPTHPGQHNKAADAVDYFDLLFLYVKCWSSIKIQSSV